LSEQAPPRFTQAARTARRGYAASCPRWGTAARSVHRWSPRNRGRPRSRGRARATGQVFRHAVAREPNRLIERG